ncbi:hypothetical protein MLD38_020960 [Melastoma candidum]|uniref:Uncharacterized protein n=1 Tax=Melastoma candidum TaxID=119954 RepID=A0ACB9QFV3_9MYRT|nr:hypothetical protein MLD38_020960 [Melastoma candidum]
MCRLLVLQETKEAVRANTIRSEGGHEKNGKAAKSGRVRETRDCESDNGRVWARRRQRRRRQALARAKDGDSDEDGLSEDGAGTSGTSHRGIWVEERSDQGVAVGEMPWIHQREVAEASWRWGEEAIKVGLARSGVVPGNRWRLSPWAGTPSLCVGCKGSPEETWVAMGLLPPGLRTLGSWLVTAAGSREWARRRWVWRRREESGLSSWSLGTTEDARCRRIEAAVELVCRGRRKRVELESEDAKEEKSPGRREGSRLGAGASRWGSAGAAGSTADSPGGRNEDGGKWGAGELRWGAALGRGCDWPLKNVWGQFAGAFVEPVETGDGCWTRVNPRRLDAPPRDCRRERGVAPASASGSDPGERLEWIDPASLEVSFMVRQENWFGIAGSARPPQRTLVVVIVVLAKV